MVERRAEGFVLGFCTPLALLQVPPKSANSGMEASRHNLTGWNNRVTGTICTTHLRCVVILDVAFVVRAMLVVSFMTPLVPQVLLATVIILQLIAPLRGLYLCMLDLIAGDCITTHQLLKLLEGSNKTMLAQFGFNGLSGQSRPTAPPGFQSGQQPTQQAFSPQQQALLSGTVQGSTPANGQATLLPQAFNTMTLRDPTDANWNMDTGASSHLNSNATNLSTLFNSCMYPSVLVGDGKSIPVTNMGHNTLPTPYRPLHLNNVLITPNIVKNLISVRQFVRDNKCTIEFDEFGFSVKDYWTRQILLRCDSTGDLYPVTSLSYPQAFLVGQQTWHQRLGHPGSEVLRHLVSNNLISCNKTKSTVLCHACQLGKHVRLPFSLSETVVKSPFDIIHSDLWTSPLSSVSGIKYYVLFLDHFSHYLWVYPLRNKSDALSKFIHFRAFVKNQFQCDIKSLQCDHGARCSKRTTIRRYLALLFSTLACLSLDVKMLFSWFIIRRLLHAAASGFWITTSRLFVFYSDLYMGLSKPLGHGFRDLQHMLLDFSSELIIATLHAEFSMTDLGPLNYFLGISVTRNTSGMFLSQQKYASELLERAGMLTCNPCRTPVDTDSKLSADGDPVSDPTLYRSLAGALQYLTFTRPDISFAVQQVCLYMHDPREPHFSALKRILRYIRGTMPYGLQLFSSTTSSLVAYSDADWAGCPTTRRSTSVPFISLLIRAHQRTKHIEIDIHFVRDLVAAGHIRVLHVPSRYQYADIFTKGLPTVLFDEFRSSLSVRSSPAQTAGDVSRCFCMAQRLVLMIRPDV
ncbi:ribonuclease H-like domain-containing protein [Tanacetum coccineum]